MLSAFDYDFVRLEDSMVNEEIKKTMDYYLNISEDNFFKYMRETAGLKAPGNYFTGWFSNSHGVMLAGQFISAFSRMYAITRDIQFRDKAISFFNNFKHCYKILQNTDKALFKKTSFYDYEKLLRAIIDLHKYCQYDEPSNWIEYLLDFASETMSTENLFGNNITEWYTMPESLLAVYQEFGFQKAKDLAFKWEYREFWDLFYKDADPFSKRPVAGLYSEFVHAYSHVNSFNSCAKFYEVTKDPYYLAALRKFYHFMQREEVLATGGYGPNFEHLMPKYRIIDALRTGHDSFETQCDTYAAFRLCKYLTRFTGEAQFGNWVESLVYNAAVTTIPMTEDGRVMYYSDYNMYGAHKYNRKEGWTCCTGTRPLLMAEIPRLIYYHDDDSLYVSQFIPSEVKWELPNGNAVSIKQQTNFPQNDEVVYTFRLEKEETFAFKLRLPAWMKEKADISIKNSRDEIVDAEYTVDDGGWLAIKRKWENGDTVQYRILQSLTISALDPAKNGPIAFMHGPVVLAASYSGPQTPNDWIDLKRILPLMDGVENHPLHYKVKGVDNIEFKPFYEYKEHEIYYLYHDTAAHATDRFAGKSGKPLQVAGM